MCLCVISHVYTFVFCCSETFSFMLTGEDGSRRFGYCRRLLVSPPRPPGPPTPPTPLLPVHTLLSPVCFYRPFLYERMKCWFCGDQHFLFVCYTTVHCGSRR